MARTQTRKLSPEEQESQTIKTTCSFFFRTPMLSGDDLRMPMRTQLGSTRPDLAVDKGYLVPINLSEEDSTYSRDHVYSLTPRGMSVALTSAEETGRIKISSPMVWSDDLLKVYIETLEADRNFSSATSIARKELDRRHRDLFPDEMGDAFDKIFCARRSQVDYRLDGVRIYREDQLRTDSDLDRLLARVQRQAHTPEEGDAMEDLLAVLSREQKRIADQVKNISSLAAESKVFSAVQKMARDPEASAERLGF